VLALAELFERNPGMAARMLRLHVDDGTGCCGVRSGRVRVSWPCVLCGLTARANEVGGRRSAVRDA
jgi:hypothetical protein